MKRAHAQAIGTDMPDLPSGTSILYCRLCGAILHVTTPDDLEVYPEAWEAHLEKSERACAEHLEARHPLRYWLWKRTGWRWAAGGLR